MGKQKKKKQAISLPRIVKITPKTLVLEDGKSIILHAAEDKVINVNTTAYIKTGVKIILPDGYYGLLRTVTATFINNSVSIHHVTNHIFPDQREDEVMIALTNEGEEPFLVSAKAPIAVLRIMKGAQVKPRIKEVSL